VNAGIGENEKNQLLVLGAGRPLNAKTPSAVEEILGPLTALRWNMASARVGPEVVQLVAGYDLRSLEAEIPDIAIHENPRWETTLSVGSLFCIPYENKSALVVYSDIVANAELFDDLKSTGADIAIAWDQSYLEDELSHFSISKDLEKVQVKNGKIFAIGRESVGAKAAGFFPGIVWLSASARKAIHILPEGLKDRLSTCHLSELVEHLSQSGFSVQALESKGQWARVEDIDGLAKFVLGSKADSLIRLKPLLKKSRVPDSLMVTLGFWKSNRHEVLEEIKTKFGDIELVVRSNSLAEDSFHGSQAGAFLTVLRVKTEEEIALAVERVYGSFNSNDSGEQVLIQPMIQNLVVNGVIATRSLATSSPWVAINYEESTRSDGITSGRSKDAKTIQILREPGLGVKLDFTDPKISQRLPNWTSVLLQALDEIERVLHYDRLDIEFAIDADWNVHVFQVRPLIQSRGRENFSDHEVIDAMGLAAQTWEEHKDRWGGYYDGTTPALSNMTDWNPAEILGVSPGDLALSLYQYLVTNDVWSESRSLFGYRDMSGRRLIVGLAGRPYVDVLASLESFIPGALSDEEAKQLLTFFANRLKDNPSWHDKVEFEIVPTCLTPDFEVWKNRLRDEGLFAEDLIERYELSLLDVTMRSFEGLENDLLLLERLDREVELIFSDSSANASEKIEAALDACRSLGTLPFANLARRAFVSVAILRDGVKANILSDQGMGEFLGTINSVSHDMGRDAQRTKKGDLAWDDFVARYGHLRPGTYEVLSPRYDSSPDFFLRPLVDQIPETHESSDASTWKMEREELFDWVNLRFSSIDRTEIESFLRDSIEARESAKFKFTRTLSRILEELKELVGTWGITEVELSNLNLSDILFRGPDATVDESFTRALRVVAAKNADRQRVANLLKLPDFISKSIDFKTFIQGAEAPNFVGNRSVIAETALLESGIASGTPGRLDGCIVLIESADPGYDWIFGHAIAGLVTMYGGANSHMAIRAAEFGLPAAIGVGQVTFESLPKHGLVELDPSSQTLRGMN